MVLFFTLFYFLYFCMYLNCGLWSEINMVMMMMMMTIYLVVLGNCYREITCW